MLVLRNFQLSDLDQIMYHVASIFDQVNTPDFYMIINQYWPEGFLVLEKDEKFAGFIIGNRMEGGCAKILIMAVVDGSLDRGYGSMILEEFENRCRSDKIKKIVLEVRVSNPGAQRFYLREGFKTTGLEENFYQDLEDAYILEKML